MAFLRTIQISVALATLLVLPATAADQGHYRPARWTPTYSTALTSDVSYGAAAVRKYDVYKPGLSDLSGQPILVFIHGGGWTGGSKSGDSAFIGGRGAAFAAMGWVTYSINYTLAVSGNAATQHPAPIQDLKCFLSYLAEGSPIALGDVSRITLWGMSSGSDIALLAGVTPKATFGDSEHTSTAYTIKAVVTGSTPTHLETMYATSIGGQMPIEDHLGFVPSSNSAAALAASSAGYIVTPTPAIYLQVGTADTLVPNTQSTDFQTAFAAIGITVTYTAYAGLPHAGGDWTDVTKSPHLDMKAFIVSRGR